MQIKISVHGFFLSSPLSQTRPLFSKMPPGLPVTASDSQHFLSNIIHCFYFPGQVIFKSILCLSILVWRVVIIKKHWAFGEWLYERVFKCCLFMTWELLFLVYMFPEFHAIPQHLVGFSPGQTCHLQTEYFPQQLGITATTSDMYMGDRAVSDQSFPQGIKIGMNLRSFSINCEVPCLPLCLATKHHSCWLLLQHGAQCEA